MPDHDAITLTGRLLSLCDHLGLPAAHVATGVPGDVAELAARHPERIAALILCAPVRLDPAPFASVAGRMLLLSGSRGMTADVAARAAERLPGARRVVLDDYDPPGWADVAAERGEAIVRAIGAMAAAEPIALSVRAGAGSHAGITYTIQGSGPPLLLLPFFLAPSQWQPIVPALARHFTVIILGGRHLGGVAALEDRARTPTYRAMVRTLFDVIAPVPGETILDVGCGSGALDRLLAHRYGAANPITATDLNPFLLREAEVLAREDDVADSIVFRAANAESLPFPDASFDCAFSVTVLEECDADKAMWEMRRVLRPGGRAGVIVRSIDLPQWWHLDLPEELRRKAALPPQSCGPRGVADASLYPRMRAAGFSRLTCFPALVTFDQPEGPIWRYREDHVLSQLSPTETAAWRAAADTALGNGLLFMAHPLHCAVGTVLGVAG